MVLILSRKKPRADIEPFSVINKYIRPDQEKKLQACNTYVSKITETKIQLKEQQLEP